MQRHLLALAASALLLSCNFMNASAQSTARTSSGETPRYEIGAQVFAFNGRELGLGYGAGGRFTYNLNAYVALDNEVNFFLPDEGPPYATEGLFGVKIGKHGKHVGVFAKARPGFQTNFVVNGQEQTRFAFDVGGVAEIYPNRHLVLRFDAGDVIIPFGSDVVGASLFGRRPGTTHNLQINFGVGFRF
jgi:hypothetical protein